VTHQTIIHSIPNRNLIIQLLEVASVPRSMSAVQQPVAEPVVTPIQSYRELPTQVSLQFES
jgi:hypothetical protein